ncbi:MAG: dTDP-4-dehydrorhamnose reductase [Terriglobales bacterium]
MRVTIFGATGLLGKALIGEWREDQVTGLGSRHVDIRSEEQVQAAITRHRPEWIVLAAAYTDVDGCETNRDLAFDVNCKGAANVVREATRAGTRLIFLSTDYVFDGMKGRPYEIDDPLAPQSVYGQTKAAAEVEIRKILPECCILRTSWVFGVGGKCFPDTILQLAGSRKELEVVDDQRGCPTYTVDLARTIISLCRHGATGTVHATNRGDCTWFDFASEIVASAGLHTQVKPTSSEKFVRPAKRPKYSVLSSASLEPYGILMPTWRDAMLRYLAERGRSS